MNLKYKYLILTIVICIMLSLTAVSASDDHTDVNQGLAPEEIGISDDSNEKLMEKQTRTYTDFFKDIENCTDTFDMKSDYKYVESDNASYLEIEKGNFMIKGNNHVIDGSASALGILFTNSEANLTICDLTFVNCSMYAIDSYGNLTLINVNFTSNGAENPQQNDGILAGNANKHIIINKCNFDLNYNSTIINSVSTDVSIYNSRFSNTRTLINTISIYKAKLEIENCTFENLSAKYGGAINFKGADFTMRNTKFANVHADLTGGAIIIKFFPIKSAEDAMLIDGCTFTNASSGHNGGAIYVDLDSASEDNTRTLNILNSNFTDVTSGFGGAIADQGGIINIINDNFINCNAKNLGGAIYTSWANLTVVNTSFLKCSAGKNAGALYFDYGKLVIHKSNFTANNVNSSTSGKEAIIYANDVNANITCSTFKNGIVAIYANFKSNSNIADVDSDGVMLLNNTDYIVSVENKGIKLNLTGNDIVFDKLPARFDARDWGWASPLKYQGDNFACWAFSTAGAIECALLKQTGVLYNISEDNIQNLQLKYYSEGDLRDKAIGFAYSGLGHALSWYGIVTAEDDPYDERGMFSNVVEIGKRIHLQDAIIIFGGRNDTNDLLKEAILRCGAASIHFSSAPFDYANQSYSDDDLQPTHFVTVIGWDDNYPAEKFREGYVTENNSTPQGNGAWLIKDSESATLNESECVIVGSGGYLRISYYNPSFLAKDFLAIVPQSAAVAYIFENDIEYHVNYQTDLTGLTGFDGNYTYYSNEFTSNYDELIGAVGTYFNWSGIDYSFDVYVNGNKVISQSGVSEFAGFKTIVLNKYIPVKAGDKFKVVFKNNNLPYQAYSRQHYVSGMSMVSADGSSWRDITLENKTVCLKIYTVKDDSKIINNTDINVNYAEGQYFTVKVATADGHAIGEGAEVNFTINGKTTTAITDDEGIAKFKINELPGAYPVTTTYNNQTYKNTVTVVLDLNTCKVIDNRDITVDYNSESYFAVRVVSADGKVMASGVPVTFKINGETSTVETDENGIASFKLPSLNPGAYPIETTYNDISVINTVTVLQNNNSNDTMPDVKPAPNKIPTNYNSQSNHVYTLYRASDMKLICYNVVNLKALMDLFNLNLTNGHLKVYIDGTLVFEGYVDDDLSKVIFEIIEKYLGKHEITIEFTDSNGNTQKYNETMIIE